MDHKNLSLPSKEHLTIRLSSSAELLLTGIVNIAEKSSSPVISVTNVPAAVLDSRTYRVKSTDNKDLHEVASLFGVPNEELELFRFIIPLGNNKWHVTALAFERAKYNKSSRLKKFFLRATPLQALVAISITFVGILAAVLVTLLTILVNLRQLMVP